MRSERSARDSLHIWDGFLLFASHEIVNTYHSHYAASIVVAVGSGESAASSDAGKNQRAAEPSLLSSHPIRIEDEAGRRSTYDAVLIPPNYPHRLSAPGRDVLVLQIDPDLDEFQSLAGLTAIDASPLALDAVSAAMNSGDGSSAAKGRRPAALRDRVVQLFFEDVACDEAMELCRDLLRIASAKSLSESESESGRQRDERVDTVLQHLRNLEELPVDINTEEMARLVGLSEERFRAIFKAHMGLRFRRYLLWLRLRRAAVLLGDGVTLTEAAHASGFYDSAHFSRTFREMFGHAPSDILGRAKGLRIHAC
ncbi:MAG: helix-turn-helix domain-containing protein [bacterium]|nr:helix-turn-helix domain-containing protein [bacterium]